MAPTSPKRTHSPKRSPVTNKRPAHIDKSKPRRSPRIKRNRIPTIQHIGISKKKNEIEVADLQSDADGTNGAMLKKVKSVEQFLIDNSHRQMTSLASTSQVKRSHATLDLLEDSISKLTSVKKKRFAERLGDMAVEYLCDDVMKKLRIIGENVLCVPHKDLSDEAPPNVFGWTWVDFWERCNNANILWVDLLLLNKEEDLEIFKFQCDMHELQNMLKMLFNGLTSMASFAREEVVEYIRDTHEYIDILHILTSETERVLHELQHGVNVYLDRKVAHRRGGETLQRRVALDEQLDEANAYYPIELRYQLNWIDAKTAQAELKKTLQIDALENRLEEIRQNVEKEAYISKQVTQHYYIQAENYTNQISQFNAKYEIEYDRVNNELNFMKLSMDKMVSQRGFLEEQMIRFQEEIEQMKQQMLEDEEREQRESMEREAEQQKTRKPKKGKQL